MNRRELLASVVSSALAAAPALAQDAAAEPPPSELSEAIEVVARGYEASAATAVPKVTVLGRGDIERRQAGSVSELLSEVPGALVLPDGPRGQFTRLYMRGAASNQTLVLVDGIPQNDSTAGGAYDWNDLGTASVERVEVLAGSYGVLYGGEAIGGVVSVTSRRGLGPWRGFLRAETGSFSSHRESVGFGGGDEEFDLWVTGAKEGSEGERDREQFALRDVSTRAGFGFSRKLRADWTIRSARSTVEAPFDFPAFGSTVLPTDENIERTRDTLSTGVTFTADPFDWLTARLTASYLDVDSTFENGPDGPQVVDPDFTPGTGDEVTVVRDELDSDNHARDLRLRLAPTVALSDALGWRSREDGGVEVNVTVGGEWLDQDSRSDVSYPDFAGPGTVSSGTDRSIDTTSVFAQAEALLPDLGAFRRGVVALGARRDRNDAFGSETSPFVGGRVEFEPSATTLRATWGQGFRAPKPAELDDPDAGNPDLGAETSESFDAGVVQSLAGGRVEVGATWFRLDTDDLIAFDPSATSPARPFGQLVNFQRTRTTGWELAGRADLGAGFVLRGSFTLQDPRDRSTDAHLPNRSERFASGGIAWERGTLLVSLDALVSSKFPDQGGEYTYPEGDARRSPGRRTLVSLATRWRPNDTLSLFARVENLLDDDWVATPTSPAGPPFAVYAGFEIRF